MEDFGLADYINLDISIHRLLNEVFKKIAKLGWKNQLRDELEQLRKISDQNATKGNHMVEIVNKTIGASEKEISTEEIAATATVTSAKGMQKSQYVFRKPDTDLSVHVYIRGVGSNISFGLNEEGRNVPVKCLRQYVERIMNL